MGLTVTTHNIKCWPGPFQAMEAGDKTFEYRLNDRDYEVGDILNIMEWNPEANEGQGNFTNRELKRIVTYMLRGGKFGLPKRYVVMAVRPLSTT